MLPPPTFSCIFLIFLNRNTPLLKDYSSLLANIRRYVDFTPEEAEAITSIIRITQVRKRQFIDQPGFVSGYRN